MPLLSKLASCLLLLFAPTLWAQSLPADLEAAFVRARIPKEAVSLYVVDAGVANAAPLLAHRASAAMNPASTMKLVTSAAALDLLGPAYTWQTQVLIDAAGKDGAIKNGVLNGDVIIKGGGDPKLVVERLGLLLNRIRSLGIQTINGDMVLDNSAFAVPATNPAAFDGEPSKPYNASPDALLINYKSVVMTFTPNAWANAASVQYDPPLAGIAMPASVPLSNADCGDYRSALRADFSDAKRIRFLGSYPKSCGERVWSIAYADPSAFAALAVRGLWEGMGGKLLGISRAGQAPAQAKLAFTLASPSLADVMRDMNKFSNNVMAQQLFLTLSLNADSSKPASFEASRAVLAAWWRARYGATAGMDAPTVDNGSGLSRSERITSGALARLLQDAYAAPFMPELIASLPQTGVDGTLRNSKAALGIAHLKTGSLNSVAARAGYVDSQKTLGKRYVLVAIVNSDNPAVIAQAPGLFDALISWTAAQ
ncbi:MAG: D-alanyl-D-alanine carboxypeptidase/D-alanyl-D-alanine-endopeptidase [Cytophagales bacterium]|nr:D-alanyl-D-alanine carboxypeptidase/D-alanyl-D-alanine-endopeptidase [Cytophagales bacterium]